MSKQPTRGIFGFVVIAGLITLAVSGVRLFGEIQAWPGFSTAVGGPSIVGIVWLVPIFGLLFGRRLAQSGKAAPKVGRALLLCLLGFGAIAGGIAYAATRETPADSAAAAELMWITGGVAAMFGFAIWPAVFGVNLFYAILARAPVIAIQYIAIEKQWGTHYEKTPPAMGQLTPAEAAHGLMMAQLVIWIPFTIIVGGLFAAIGAASVRRR